MTVQLYHINICKRHVPFIVGTANANVSVEKIATEMVGVIYNYKPRHVQEVHVVIWQSSTLKSFIDATHKYMDKIKRETAGMMEKIVETVGIGKIVYHFKHCFCSRTCAIQHLSFPTSCVPIYGPKVFLLTKIKPEYYDIL